MSTEIVPASMDARMEYSKALAASSLLPKQYQRQPANVLVALEYGAALGLSPMAAIQGVHVVEGKPTASAQLIGALVRNAGHRLRVTGNDKTATATIVRRDDPEFEFTATWTIDRAKAAGLTGKGVWKQYPAAMLKARAITEVARDACPDVLAGVAYTEEELEPIQATTTPVRLHAVEEVVDTDTGEVLDDYGDIDPQEIIDEQAMTAEQVADVLDAEIIDEPEPAPKATGPTGNITTASDAQLRMIFRLTKKLQLGKDDALATIGEILGREIAGSDELSKKDASAAITQLKVMAGEGDD